MHQEVTSLTLGISYDLNASRCHPPPACVAENRTNTRLPTVNEMDNDKI